MLRVSGSKLLEIAGLRFAVPIVGIAMQCV